MTRHALVPVAIVLLLPFFTPPAPSRAAEPGPEATWPEFHGPKRDNISTETGLLKKWPEGGPALLWTFDDCGAGYSGVAIAEGKIFTAGDLDEQESLITLDLDGKLLWKSPNGKSWTGPTPGSRTTPTYRDGVLYHMNPTGRLAAYRAGDGEELWAVELKERFNARYGVWAMAENVIVDGDKVFCLPGSRDGFAAALDKETGKTVWVNKEMALDIDRAAYGSPVLVDYGGVRQLVTLSDRRVVAMDVETGRMVWSHPFPLPNYRRFFQNTNPPVFHKGHVFVTGGHKAGGVLLKLKPNLSGADVVWYKESFDNCHGSVILLDGRLYGCGCRLSRQGFFCVDFLSGEVVKNDPALGKVSITYADGMLYCVDHKGPMSLLKITPDGFEVVSRFELPKKSKDLYLCHPVVCGGRLYVRHDRWLYCYDVRAE
jgi:outer membrane protein assembly factor BamB